MGWLIRVLTAVTFAVHMVVGCCVHHAHAYGSPMQASLGHGAAVSHDPCPGTSADATHHAGHGVRICLGEKCSATESSSPDSNWFAQPLQALVAPLLDDQYSQISAGCEQRFFATGWLLPPVRLHLANQILLI